MASLNRAPASCKRLLGGSGTLTETIRRMCSCSCPNRNEHGRDLGRQRDRDHESGVPGTAEDQFWLSVESQVRAELRWPPTNAWMAGDEVAATRVLGRGGSRYVGGEEEGECWCQ